MSLSTSGTSQNFVESFRPTDMAALNTSSAAVVFVGESGPFIGFYVAAASIGLVRNAA